MSTTYDDVQQLHEELFRKTREIDSLKDLLSQKDQHVAREQAKSQDLLFRISRFYAVFDAMELSRPNINTPLHRFLPKDEIDQLLIQVATANQNESALQAKERTLHAHTRATRALAQFMAMLLGVKKLVLTNFMTDKPELFMRLRDEMTNQQLEFSLQIDKDAVIYKPSYCNIEPNEHDADTSFLAGGPVHLIRDNIHFWTPVMMGSVFGWTPSSDEEEEDLPLVFDSDSSSNCSTVSTKTEHQNDSHPSGKRFRVSGGEASDLQ